MDDQNSTHHLTDDEFSMLLDGAEPGPLLGAHLVGCEFCRRELEVVQQCLGDFRGVSSAWAEAKAPFQVPVPTRWLERRQVQQTWGFGLGATAVTGVLAFLLGFLPTARQGASPHIQALAPATADLAADNRLLSSIDAELSDQMQPPVAGVEAHPGSQHGAHHLVSVNTD